MALTEQAIVQDLHLEIERARKSGMSGEIRVTLGMNQGAIARAEINLGRAIKAQPQPREARYGAGVV